MKIISSVGLFLTSEWIWAVTFARAHILLSMPILLISFLIIGKARLVPAVLYAFFAPIFSITVFTFFIHAVVDGFLGINFPADAKADILHPFPATFLLAMLYVFLQWIFFYLLSLCYNLPIKRYTFAALIGNLITMALVYKFIPKL